MKTEHVVISLEHVCCHEHALRLTRRSVAHMAGVIEVSLDATKATAHVEFDPRRSTRAEVIAAVRAWGYRAGEFG